MRRARSKTAGIAQGGKTLPRGLERMIEAYVDVVLPGQPKRNTLAARIGVRVIVEHALRGAPR